MPTIRDLVGALRRRDGVDAAVVLGRDGLVIDGQASDALDVEHVAARVPADERLKALPCVILTAAGQEQQYRRAMQLGATDFLTKPFSPKKLYARAAELAGVSDESARER